MKKSRSRLHHIVVGAAAIPAAWAAVTWLAPASALACDGNPPPPDCGVAISCQLAAGRTATASAAGEMGEDGQVKMVNSAPLQGGFNLTITGDDPRCPGQTGELAFDVVAENCIVDGVRQEETIPLSSQSTTLVDGPNTVPMKIELPAGPKPRACDVKGEISVTLSSGQRAQSSCEAECVSFVDETEEGEKRIELSIKDEDEKPWVRMAAAGQPQEITFVVKNNTDLPFNGSFKAGSENNAAPASADETVPDPADLVPDPAVQCAAPATAPVPPADCSQALSVEVCGCDGKLYANSCAMGNAGVALYSEDAEHPFCNPAKPAQQFYVQLPSEKADNFPFAIKQDEEFDVCLTRPRNSADTEAMVRDIDLPLAAGEEREITVVVRSWNTCATCSNNGIPVKIDGTFGTEGVPYRLCNTAAVTVNASVEPAETVCPDDPIKPEPSCAADDVCCLEPTNPCCVDDVRCTRRCDEGGQNCLTHCVSTAPTPQQVPNVPFPTSAADCDDEQVRAQWCECTEVFTRDPSDDTGPVRTLDCQPKDRTTPEPVIPDTCRNTSLLEVKDSDNDLLPDVFEETIGSDPNNPDSNGDGIDDFAAVARGLNPTKEDTDGDGLSDKDELSPEWNSDPLNPDSDGDAIVDGDETAASVWDPDTDRDTLFDGVEAAAGFMNTSANSKGAEFIDGFWSRADGATPTLPAFADADQDGLEDPLDDDPNNADQDNDGLHDGREVYIYRTSPTSTDSDGDGLSDLEEVSGIVGKDGRTYRTNPTAKDTDNDGLTDADELRNYGTDPRRADTDGDSLIDGDEVNVFGSDPLSIDTDAQGADDRLEVEAGVDPAAPGDGERAQLARSAEVTLVLRSANEGRDVAVTKRASTLSEVIVARTWAAIDYPNGVGRFNETIALSQPAPGKVARLTSVYEFRNHSGAADHPVEALSMVPKGTNLGDSAFVGLGGVGVGGAPRSVFEVNLLGSVWAEDEGGNKSELAVSNANYMVDLAAKTITVTADVALPERPVSEVYFMSDFVTAERNDFEVDCANRVDDDGNGKTDCEDPSCRGVSECSGSSGPDSFELCGNGMDDDNDGLTDCGDSDCANTEECRSGIGGRGPGLGEGGCGCSATSSPAGNLATFALFGLGLLGLRRRRRATDAA